MIQPGMTFGSEGPVVQGTWINPSTGDFFTVRDAFFEDNQYVITTTDGRYINYEQFKNYVQTDPKSVESMKQSIVNNKVKEEPLPAEVSSIIDSDNSLYADYILPDDNILSKPLGNLNDPKPVQYAYSEPKPLQQDMNTVIIKKALSKADKPKFKVTLDWKNFPEKEIEMLHDIMSIDIESITEWYLDNIQMIDIVDTIKDSIKSKILKKSESILQPAVPDTDTPTVETIETPKKQKKEKSVKTTKSKK